MTTRNQYAQELGLAAQLLNAARHDRKGKAEAALAALATARDYVAQGWTDVAHLLGTAELLLLKPLPTQWA